MVMLKRSLANLDRGQQGAEKSGKALTSFRVYLGVFRFLYASALCYTAGGVCRVDLRLLPSVRITFVYSISRATSLGQQHFFA